MKKGQGAGVLTFEITAPVAAWFAFVWRFGRVKRYGYGEVTLPAVIQKTHSKTKIEAHMNQPKYKGIPIDIGGETLIIPPVSLGSIEKVNQQIKFMTGSAADPGNISALIDIIHAAIIRNYPEITRDRVAESIDLENMNEILEAVMDVGGVKRRKTGNDISQLN